MIETIIKKTTKRAINKILLRLNLEDFTSGWADCISIQINYISPEKQLSRCNRDDYSHVQERSSVLLPQ